jgi:hypothetical protein
MRVTVISCVLISAISAGAAAQHKSADPTVPQFVQSSTNVFRRFAVDLAKMKAFYGEVLGLQPLPTINMPGGGQMTRFHVGTWRSSYRAATEAKALTGGVKDFTGLRVLTFFFPEEAALTARFRARRDAPSFTRTPARRTALPWSRIEQSVVELVVVPGAPRHLRPARSRPDGHRPRKEPAFYRNLSTGRARARG